MYVLDGQHRLDIAKKHKLKIYYIIDAHSVFDDIQQLNIGTKVWSRKDHLEFFTKCKFPVYCFINELLKKYHISLSVLLQTFASGGSKRLSLAQNFKRGELSLKFSEDKIVDFMNKYEDIYRLYKLYIHYGNPSTAFQQTMMAFIIHLDYEHNRMLKAIQLYPDSFISLNNIKSVDTIKKTILDQIYNKRISTRKQLEM